MYGNSTSPFRGVDLPWSMQSNFHMSLHMPSPNPCCPSPCVQTHTRQVQPSQILVLGFNFIEKSQSRMNWQITELTIPTLRPCAIHNICHMLPTVARCPQAYPLQSQLLMRRAPTSAIFCMLMHAIITKVSKTLTCQITF